MRFKKYFEPTSIKECTALLNEYGKSARILAGGTDIVPRLKNKIIKIETLISLQSIPELYALEKTDEGLKIGAMVTLRNITKSKLLDDGYKVIAEAAGHISSMQVRNIATIGGNTCNASPSADSVPALLVSDAFANISGPQGERKIPLINFFKGPGKTDLQEGELLTGFTVPVPALRTGAVYKKFTIRGDTDISIVGVGARLDLNSNGVIENARIALAAVGPTPIRAYEVEKLLVGKVFSDELVKEAGNLAEKGCNPITDQRATKEYRKEMVNVWVRNALIEAEQRAKAAK